MHSYVFAESKAKGRQYERVLDGFFRSRYAKITEVVGDEQVKGYDRIFTCEDGSTIKVEYKADLRAHETRNIFAELLHYRPKPDGLMWSGWVQKTEPDYFALILPGFSRVLWIPSTSLRSQILEWNFKHPKATIHNEGLPGQPSFYTQGIRVPLEEFKRISESIHKMPD